jgi:hypothetical protein
VSGCSGGREEGIVCGIAVEKVQRRGGGELGEAGVDGPTGGRAGWKGKGGLTDGVFFGGCLGLQMAGTGRAGCFGRQLKAVGIFSVSSALWGGRKESEGEV